MMRPINPHKPYKAKRGTIPGRFDGLAIPTPGKKAKPSKRAKTPEAAIQEQVENYLKLRGLAFFHIPDALLKAGFSKGSAVNWALINAAADVRGFPDLIIFDPARFGICLCVELKTEVGTESKNQKAWRIVLGTKLCRSFDEAKAEIDSWLNDPIGYWKLA